LAILPTSEKILVPRPGVGPAAFDGGHEGGLLAGDESARAADDLQVEDEARPQDVGAEEAVGPGLLEGFADAVDGQGVLVPDVEKTPVRADGPGPDDQAFDDGVGIGLEHRAVHERARIALVAVADDVLGAPLRVAGGLPFHAGGEARPAPAAQARGGDLGDNPLRRHLPERLGRRFVSVGGDIIVDPLRIDPSPVAEDDQALVLEERDVLHVGDGLALLRGDVHQPPDGAAFDQVLLDELRDVGRRQALVENAVGLDDDDRPPFAESVAARGDDLDFAPEPPSPDLGFEVAADPESSA
jgi:hypothetical protein